MRDLSIESNDLVVSGYQLQLVEGIPLVAQRIAVRLRSFLGEWYLDRSYGTAYIDNLMKKNPERTLAASIIRNTISAVPGVSSVDKIDIQVDGATRISSIVFEVTATDGSTQGGEVTV